MPPIAIVENVIRRESSRANGDNYVYYLAQIRASLAYDLTFVPVLADEAKLVKRARKYLQETDNGYQRPGSYRRMEAFARYLLDEDAAYTPAIVLSSRGQWDFVQASNSLVANQPAAIIDGQHRMGGFIAALQEDGIDRIIDVVILDVDGNAEEKAFLDINSNAKSVSTGIVAVLGRNIDAQVASALNSHPGSIFRDRFYISQVRPGTLFNIASVAKNISTTFSHGVFEGIKEDVDLKFEIMLGYWEIIASEFAEEWDDIEQKKLDRSYKLLELTGLIAMSLSADEILAPAFDMKASAIDFEKVERTVRYLAESKALDWRKNGEFRGLTGHVGGSQIHKRIQQILSAMPDVAMDFE